MRRIALIFALVHVGTAWADRQDAERLAKEAKADRDPAKLVACGKAYVEVQAANPAAPDADEALYNGAVCFEEAGSIGAAIQVQQSLRASYPRSKYGVRALARLARMLERIGALAKAADALEEYAKQYGGEKDAYDALSDAAYLRGVLGDDAKRAADIQFFLSQYGVKRPQDVASPMLSLADLAKTPQDAIKRYRDFLAGFGSKNRELAVRAHMKIGELTLQLACPKPTVDGLCVQLASVAKQPGRCGAASTWRYTRIARDPKRVAEAVAELAAARKLYESSASKDPAAVFAAARARLLVADVALEEAIAIQFPTTLDFSPANKPAKAASLQRFDDYVARKTAASQAAQKQYEDVIALADASTEIAALARIGTLTHAFATDIETGEIPKDVRQNPNAADKTAAFCDKLHEIAEPIAARALVAFDKCIERAGELGVHDAAARTCARDRGRIEPKKYGVTDELVAEPPIATPVRTEPPVPARAVYGLAFADAVAAFAKLDGTRPACERVVAKFETIGKLGVADAHYMAGLAYGTCGLAAKAKVAYERALQLDARHAASVSNLGELEWRAGNVAAAKQRWEAALAIDQKLAGAHVGLAAIGLGELRADPKRAQDIDLHASSAAAVDDTRIEPYVELAILALETGDTKRARYYARRAARIDERPVPVGLVRATIADRAGDPSALALRIHAADPLALAVSYVKLQRWNDARAALANVKTPSYELAILRGIVARSDGKLAEAETHYTGAIALASARPEAHWNLGVLWKEYVAARAPDPATARTALRKAAESFRRAGTAEAKQLAADCDKAIAGL